MRVNRRRKVDFTEKYRFSYKMCSIFIIFSTDHIILFFKLQGGDGDMFIWCSNNINDFIYAIHALSILSSVIKSHQSFLQAYCNNLI